MPLCVVEIEVETKVVVGGTTVETGAATIKVDRVAIVEECLVDGVNFGVLKDELKLG